MSLVTRITALATSVASKINELADTSNRFPVTKVSHGYTVGKFVELDGSTWTTTLTVSSNLRGVVAAVIDADTFIVQTRGIVSGLSGMTPGGKVYSSDTGVLSGAWSFWGAGTALSATDLLVDPWLPAVGSIVKFSDEKASGVSGGAFSAGAWEPRTLNADGEDLFGLVSRSGSTLTPIPGAFEINWSSPAYGVGMHQTRLYDTGNSELVKEGSQEWASVTYGAQNRSTGEWAGSIVSGMVLRIDHKCANTSSPYGFGNSASFGLNVYTQVSLTYLGPL